VFDIVITSGSWVSVIHQTEPTDHAFSYFKRFYHFAGSRVTGKILDPLSTFSITRIQTLDCPVAA
jgi:hypothetical protein